MNWKLAEQLYEGRWELQGSVESKWVFQAKGWDPLRALRVWVLCLIAHLSEEENAALFKEELAGFPLNKPSKMENNLWDERNI